MHRTLFLAVFSTILCGFVCTACARNPEFTDPAKVANDPDFNIQGEYLSQGNVPTGDAKEQFKAGAQVIAIGDGKFAVVLYKGGLPGDGWKRGDSRKKIEGKREGKEVVLSLPADAGKPNDNDVMVGSKIADGTMTIVTSEGTWTLKRMVRHSATEGAKPPAGATVLFDGTTAENFENGKLLEDKNLLSDAASKQKFGDHTLHLEFRLSYMPTARGQDRSNSGVFVHDCYEIQVLDSFGLEGENNECGGFYQIRKPDVNMCYPPLTWQTYDVDLTAPKYKDGKKVANAVVVVRHNGVVVHPKFELPRCTPGREEEGPAPRCLYLQGHGNKVEYRNIWVVEKK
jgi:hypothetical protein